MALVHAGLGEREAVFEWLDKAYAARDVHLIYLPVDHEVGSVPRRSALRRSPRPLRLPVDPLTVSGVVGTCLLPGCGRCSISDIGLSIVDQRTRDSRENTRQI